MKKVIKLLLLSIVMMITAGIMNAQTVRGNADTVKIQSQQREQQRQDQEQNKAQGQTQDKEQNRTQSQRQTQGQTQGQGQTGNQQQTQAQTQANAGNQSGSNNRVKGQNQGVNATGVKKVQSARPDWSKARGARPASVERSSGSAIPRGAGRPGGAKGPGKR